MISAATVRPDVDFRSLPSPASRTSSRLMLSPALPASFSTTILSPGATRYCLPPVRTIANIGSLSKIRGRAACSTEKPGRAESVPPKRRGAECQPRLVLMHRLQAVAGAVEPVEQSGDRRMVDLAAILVGNEVLLADVCDVARLRIFREQVVEGLVPGRPQLLGD